MLNTLEQNIVAKYEDLVWQVAGGNEDAAITAESASICCANAKTVKDFASDVEAIRRRIALQGEIEDAVAAQRERDSLLAKRQKLNEEFEVVRKQQEEKLQAIDAEIRSAERRIKNTAAARKHYRETDPAWLKDRRRKVGVRLTEIKKSLLERPPTPPTDPLKSIAMIMDSEQRAETNERYRLQLAKHDAAMQRYNARQVSLRDEQEALERERGTLEHAPPALRPMPENLQCDDQEQS